MVRPAQIVVTGPHRLRISASDRMGGLLGWFLPQKVLLSWNEFNLDHGAADAEMVLSGTRPSVMEPHDTSLAA